MNALDLQDAVMRERWRRSTILPNYTPRGWWECDVFELTPRGYFREFEVKVSRSDFLADAEKSRTSWKGPTKTKHGELSARSILGPTRFFFVVPDGLVTPEEVPEWAGLLVGERHDALRVSLRQMKAAPSLHRQPFGDERAKHPLSVVYYRFHEERRLRTRLAYELSESRRATETA